MQSGLFSEMVLIDVDHDRAEGEALDIAHGMAFGSPMNIYAGDYSDIDDAAITVITAGANQAPGETRLDLVNKNVAIFKSIIPQIAERDYQGILLVVSNPVDILTYVALKLSGMPANRVLGSGTTLDTARFKYALGEHLGVDPRNVHARIIGEHGDSEIAAWSLANISGIPLNDFCELRGHTDHQRNMDRIAEEVKNAAYEIIKKKRATYYGIAMTVKLLRTSILDEAQRDYVRTSMSRGRSRSGILYRHVLKNTLVPVLTFLAMTVADLLAGSVVIEQVFAVPGLGRLLLTSIEGRDEPVARAIVVLLAFAVILCNLLADLLARRIDPRLGSGAGGAA